MAMPEVFCWTDREASGYTDGYGAELPGGGWFYWYHRPGCLGLLVGPFEGKAEAVADAQGDAR